MVNGCSRTDGITTVETHDIGSGLHAEAMPVAYFPEQKLIYQGDLLNRPPNGDYPIANDTTLHFLNWIDSKKLAVEATRFHTHVLMSSPVFVSRWPKLRKGIEHQSIDRSL